jgi:hypothetical protein
VAKKKIELTEVEKYAIKGMLDAGKDSAEIAAALGKQEAEVIPHIEQIKKPAKKSGPKPPKAKDLMINKASGGRPGVAIMTEAASERGDTARSSLPTRYKTGVIHRISEGLDGEKADGEE